jgi:hypothetical protein
MMQDNYDAEANQLDRGFSPCPHCTTAYYLQCHECLNETYRSAANHLGWRMDHVGGYGCIALCPDHR